MTLPPSVRHPRLSAAAPARPHSPGTRTPFGQLSAHRMRHEAPPYSATKGTPSAPTSTIRHTHAIPAPAPHLAQSSLALKSQAPQGGAR